MCKIKKLVCLMLAVSIVLSCLSVNVFAEDEQPPANDALLTTTVADNANEGEKAPDKTDEGEKTPAEPADGETSETPNEPADGETSETPNEPADGETSQTPDGEEPGEEELDPMKFEVISDEQAISSMKKVASNGRFEMYLATDKENDYLNIGVKDTKTGAIWFTNPPNALNDPYVTGSLKIQQQAQLWVNYVDAKNVISIANSKVACVNRDTYEVVEIENGIKIIYDFSREKESFKIPVEYTITDDSFKAEVIVSEIDEYSTQKLMSVSLIPHFGAGSITDEGYLFIPDGSGAIIDFNNGQGHRLSYNRPVYGRDLAIVVNVNYTVMQQSVLPVFGLVKDGLGYVAVIEGSDADVNASPSSPMASAYNYAYANFEMRKKDSFVMGAAGDWQAKMFNVISTMPFHSSNYSTEYFFLDKEDSDYAGMARRYRKYLVDEYGFSKKTFEEELPMFLKVYGAVTRNGNFLGVPTTEVVPMTTYEELAQILQKASDLGVHNTVVDYLGWQTGGPNKKVPTKLSYENKLGGKSGYKKLLEKAQALGAEIFPNVEFVNVASGGNGYAQATLVAKAVGRTPIQLFPFSLGSGTKRLRSKPTFLVSTGLYDEIFEKFSKTYNKLGLTNLALDSVTNVVYSDYRTKEYYDINYQTQKVSENLAKLKESGVRMLMDQANDYAMVYADYLSNVPTFSSKFLITDYEVPFVQIVLHGWVPYSSPAINDSDDIQEAFLKTIETGSSPLFVITGKETSSISYSDYNFLYAAYYELWLQEAADMYTEINGILGDLQNVEIQNHRRVQDDVFETVYANGTSVLVNYSDEDVQVEGRTVKALSYDVKKGGM